MKENPANMLTKVVLRVKFKYYKKLLHIIPIVWVRWSLFGWTTYGLIS